MTATPTSALVRLRVEGYRSLRNVTLVPGRVTLLIGPNSAGKTNLLSFFQLLSVLPKGGLRHFVAERGGMSTLLHYGPKTTHVSRFRLVFEGVGSSTTYAASIGYVAGDKPFVAAESVSHSRSEPTESSFTEFDPDSESGLAALEDRLDDPGLDAMARWLYRISFYHFHDTSMTSALRQNSPGANDARLDPDGRNLAAFLYRLMRSAEPGDRAAWRRINLLARRIAPAVEALVPEPVSPGDDEDAPKHVRLRWRDDRGEVFGVDALSDGSLRAIALVTALAQPESTLPAFLSIDEPELGLHPAALAILAGLVRSVSSRCQVVLATQSPALLDHFSADEVVVVERSEGATTLRRLDTAQLKDWLAEYSLSELYDKNVLGGRP